jgi:hypothetical protein
MFFKRKKEEPVKKEDPKEILKGRYLARCQENTKSILLKLEKKYLDGINIVKEDDKEEVRERFKKIAKYIENIDWSSKIDKVLKNTTDEIAATCCLQLSWNTVRDDVNLMITNLTIFLEGVKQNGK